uniref:GRIP domain-containing protein n=1 Tax=Rhodosorus marinus TaxID=101924 RepID=A0A7S0BRA9_9RHOD
MSMALGVPRDGNSSPVDSMELILSALHSNLEGNSVSEVMELKQTLTSFEKKIAELEGGLQTSEHEKRELREESSHISRTYDAETAKVRQRESLHLKQVQVQQARSDDLLREAEERRKILESELENSLKRLSSQTADYEALVEVEDALRRENEMLKDSAGELSTLKRELVRSAEERAAIEEQCHELREKLEYESHPLEELRLRLQNLEQENETLRTHTSGTTSDDELSSLLQIKDSTICELTYKIQVLRDELRNQSASVKTGDTGSQLAEKELEAQLASFTIKSNAAQAALENQIEELDERTRRLRLVETALKNTRDECDELKRALVQAESARRKSESSSKVLNNMLQKEKESLERELSEERRARDESEQIVASMQESLQLQEKKLLSDHQALQKSIREDDEQKHKRIEELEMAAKTSAAKIENLERKLKRKDNELQLSQQTVVNLQGVLEDFQESQNSEIESSLSTLKRELNFAVENKEMLQKQLTELQQNLDADKKLFFEKDEMINSLNVTLEMFKETNLAQKEEMARILCEEPPPGANANSVEKSVVRDLLVRYFGSGTRAKREVLEIIAKTLLFSEEDMAKVGLVQGGLLTTILGGDLSKDSVSEKWVEFLMRETEEDIVTDANLVTPEEEKNSIH